MRDHPPTPLTPAEVVDAGHRGDSSTVVRAAAAADPRLRHAAVGSFHRLGELTEERLLTALRDDEPVVRHRACEIAARWVLAPHAGQSIAAVVDELVERLGDVDTVAEVAAFALGETGTALETGPAIEAGAALEDTALESTAPDGADPPEPPAAVVAALEAMAIGHEAHLCREAAVAALGALGAGKDTILRALQDRATVRRRAVIALAPFDGDDVDDALQAALDDRDWQVRQAAEDLLTITDDDAAPEDP